MIGLVEVVTIYMVLVVNAACCVMYYSLPTAADLPACTAPGSGHPSITNLNREAAPVSRWPASIRIPGRSD